jgi:hypothetical protein
MQAVSRFLFYSLAVILIGGCASASMPVHNFSAVPIGAKSNPTLDEVGKAIVKGGATAGWQMTELKPGHILGSYRIRRHLAVVDVTYSTTTYNINFKSGDEGLKYDAQAQTIHQNYNAWVEELEKLIRSVLNAL